MSKELTISRTNATNPDFRTLVKMLDKELAITDGDEHDFYHQFNGIDTLNEVVVAYANGYAMAIGALKIFDETTVEIKRMFTVKEHRGKGVAAKILQELESWAAELGYKSCILETGTRQLAALALYKKQGYGVTPNYAQYKDMANSVCFKKELV